MASGKVNGGVVYDDGHVIIERSGGIVILRSKGNSLHSGFSSVVVPEGCRPHSDVWVLVHPFDGSQYTSYHHILKVQPDGQIVCLNISGAPATGGFSYGFVNAMWVCE